jgi:6,7-dimethyl-8-ribityllumazine synthase
MPNVYRGQPNGSGLRIGVVVARWNSIVTDRLLDGALQQLTRQGVPDGKVDVSWVPGSWELPIAAQKLAQSGQYQAIVALGAVIRGEAAHFEYIANQVSAGLTEVSLATGVPITFGVLTTDDLDQALDRVGGKSGHKGAEAASAAVEMANLMRDLDGVSGIGVSD